MNLTTALKKRFAKDLELPIKIFKEPYFESRLQLFEKYNGAYTKYQAFLEMLKEFENEQAYFKYNDQVIESVISAMNSTEAYQRFNSMDMPKVDRLNSFSYGSTLYTDVHVGKELISFDMKKANYQSLRNFDNAIVLNSENYVDLMKQFTTNEHIINSKYIRQVIFGDTRLNPKRQIAHQKQIMLEVLKELLENNFVNEGDFVLLLNDEIVFERNKNIDIDLYKSFLEIAYSKLNVELGFEHFRLKKVPNTSFYMKHCLATNRVVFKDVSNFELPFLLRALYQESITEEDKVFYHEGYLAKIIDVPNFDLSEVI